MGDFAICRIQQYLDTWLLNVSWAAVFQFSISSCTTELTRGSHGGAVVCRLVKMWSC